MTSPSASQSAASAGNVIQGLPQIQSPLSAAQGSLVHKGEEAAGSQLCSAAEEEESLKMTVTH